MESLSAAQRQILDSFAKEHQVSPSVALRFLLGRKWDTERASTLLTNYQKMINEHDFGRITVASIYDELDTGKLAPLGTTAKDDSAILLITATKHRPGEFSPESSLRLAFYLAEVMTESVDVQLHGITVLVDMSGLDWSQSDYSFYRDVVQLFQNNFPCRVKNILVYQAPWWIDALVRMVSPFLKAKMRDRIHLITKPDQVTDWIEPGSLPTQLGGTAEYDHDSFVKRQLAKEATSRIGLLVKSAADGTTDEEERVPEELAEQLLDERKRVLAQLDQAIAERRALVQEQQKPVDYALLARSKAARMSMSLSDHFPVRTT